MPEPPEANDTVEVLREADRLPDDGVAVRVMVPVKPPRLVRLIVELLVNPTIMLTVVGLALRL